VTTLAEEVLQVQNPALGALLQWRFVLSYSAKRSGEPCPIPLLFLVAPILLFDETYQHLRSTNISTGIRGYAAKFGTSAANESDVLLAVHDRVRAMRHLSRNAMRVAVRTRLIGIDLPAASAFSLVKTFPKSKIPETIRPMAKNSGKLGAWCGSLTLSEVANILKVRF
jgi:hypothetical protein